MNQKQKPPAHGSAIRGQKTDPPRSKSNQKLIPDWYDPEGFFGSMLPPIIGALINAGYDAEQAYPFQARLCRRMADTLMTVCEYELSGVLRPDLATRRLP